MDGPLTFVTCLYVDDNDQYWRLKMAKPYVDMQKGFIFGKYGYQQHEAVVTAWPFDRNWLRYVYIAWVGGTVSRVVQLSLAENTWQTEDDVTLIIGNTRKQGIIMSCHGEDSEVRKIDKQGDVINTAYFRQGNQYA